ncbi:GMP synthase subunit A [Methanosalsum natronophilum]|uniref:GMP synthase [glutamine-hydrolyzing] subunit A n=1 Tax=Methanosalsum natronophilum TaxID=768733 RepID=A0A424Z166_9EURY|nr:MAG: GMP synthase subunit A [Methanosalsum natronophilum]
MKTLKILIINNHGQFCHLIHRTVRDFDMDTKIVPNITSVDSLIEEEPDCLILSGGPSMERTGLSMDYIDSIDVPILGICLGHQLIAKKFGGDYGIGKNGGYAAIDIEIMEEDDILQGLAPSISVWASHADEVTVLPKNFIHLARSNLCEIEAMKHPSRPIYGIQWHPEVSHTQKGTELFENYFRICE